MYSIYILVLCDISLILASVHNEFYGYDHGEGYSQHEVQKRSPKPGATEFTLYVENESKPKLNANELLYVSSLKKSSSSNQSYALSTATADTTSSHNNTSIRPIPIPVNDSLVISPDSYAADISSDTLKQHNITSKNEDSHVYYNSWKSYDPAIAQHYWVDLNSRSDTITHQMLSQSHRRAVTIPLPFKFQFYGHEIDNVTITTGGFLYTGDYIHSWLAATQYIAPLMANFDTSISNDSYIKYVSNSTAFTMLWENVSLQEKPKSGNFTFQVTLRKNGDIIFVYKSIPNITHEVNEDSHPVKVGLSDAYILEKPIFFVRRKTIFEYHRVYFDKRDLKNWTIIYLTPLATCQNKTTCESCLNKKTNFDCQWCDGRCSTGYDRKRQDWMKKECDKRKVNETKYCSVPSNDRISTAGAHKSMSYDEKTSQEKTNSKSIVFLLVTAVGCVVAIVAWSFYAYRNPHSTSGQILIRYRPSRWSSWRKGEARYTAATIHM